MFATPIEKGIVLALELALAACLVGCAPGNWKELQGTWETQPRPTNPLKHTWRFEEGKIVHIAYERDRLEWPYKVDATKQPKQIDIEKSGYTAMGIYKVENDVLTIAFIGPGKPKADAQRPKDFDPTKRNDVVVLTFGRKT